VFENHASGVQIRHSNWQPFLLPTSLWSFSRRMEVCLDESRWLLAFCLCSNLDLSIWTDRLWRCLDPSYLSPSIGYALRTATLWLCFASVSSQSPSWPAIWPLLPHRHFIQELLLMELAEFLLTFPEKGGLILPGPELHLTPDRPYKLSDGCQVKFCSLFPPTLDATF